MKTLSSEMLKAPHPFVYRLTKKGQNKTVVFGEKDKLGKNKDVKMDDADFEHLKEASAGFRYLIKEHSIRVIENKEPEKVKKTGLEKDIDRLQKKKVDKGLSAKEEETLKKLLIKQEG